MMKKLSLISAILMATVTPGFSQDVVIDNDMLRFGVKGGVNISNITIDNDGGVNDKRAIAGWQAGVYTDIRILPILFLQPGLFLSSKGSKFTIGDNSSGNYTEVITKPLYLEIPVNLVIKFPLAGKINIFVGAGPYAGIGVGGKNKLEGKLLGNPFSDDSKMKYSNDDPQSGSSGNAYDGNLKRFDFGLNFQAGLTINHLTLNAGYGHGLVNIKPGSDNDDTRYQNRVFSVMAGIIF